MDELMRIISDLRHRIADLERRLRNQSRTGVISSVDAQKGVARVMLIDDDKPFLTGWIPWEEATAGAAKSHIPPSVGQQVKVRSESGDLTDATIQASLNSNANLRPSSSPNEYVLLQVGEALITVKGGGSEICFKVASSIIRLTSAGVIVDGPRIDLG